MQIVKRSDVTKIISIHQPSYFPWQGLLNKIKQSDGFILLDDVQFSDGAYQNRNIFLDKNFNVQMLTIPIEKKNYLKKAIRDIAIADNRWQKKHLKFLMQNYNKHPFYDEVLEKIEPIYTKHYTHIADVLIDSILCTFNLFNINTKLLLQSDLTYNKEMKKSELVLELLKNTKASIYLSGTGAKAYQNDKEFTQNNIKLLYQEYRQTEYKQYNNDFFQAGLSSLDLLFNIGKTSACDYI